LTSSADANIQELGELSEAEAQLDASRASQLYELNERVRHLHGIQRLCLLWRRGLRREAAALLPDAVSNLARMQMVSLTIPYLCGLLEVLLDNLASAGMPAGSEPVVPQRLVIDWIDLLIEKFFRMNRTAWYVRERHLDGHSCLCRFYQGRLLQARLTLVMCRTDISPGAWQTRHCCVETCSEVRARVGGRRPGCSQLAATWS
jgi:hypothetical protein